jgi:hypothetical protein
MAYGGWVLGKLLPIEQPVFLAALKGLFLGVTVALGLAVVDGLWNLDWNQLHWVVPWVVVGGAGGAAGGLFGGGLGQLLYGRLLWAPLVLPGWVLTGLLIGVGLGAYDLFARLIRDENTWGAVRKMIHSGLGGTVGGLLGGVMYLLLDVTWGLLVRGKTHLLWWSPSAWGFVALGLCIGLLIGLAQVILKEAWVRVEAGFRRGRELILAKAVLTIGRAESCDIGLFGDSSVEKLHARLLRRGNAFFIEDAGTPGGTFVNEQRVTEQVPLRNGDAIRLGKCVLRFRERRKRAA